MHWTQRITASSLNLHARLQLRDRGEEIVGTLFFEDRSQNVIENKGSRPKNPTKARMLLKTKGIWSRESGVGNRGQGTGDRETCMPRNDLGWGAHRQSIATLETTAKSWSDSRSHPSPVRRLTDTLSPGRGLAIKNLTPTRPAPIAHKIMPGVQQKIWNMLSP
jgi:hypothetical protein